MSGRIGRVKRIDRVDHADEGHHLDLVVDAGEGGPCTCPNFADVGDDSCPLPGDCVAIVESDYCSGGEQVTGYADTKNAGIAKPGEKRIYARNSAGEVVAAVYLRNDGSVLVSNGASSIVLAASGDIVLGGNATSRVALADKVDAEIARIWRALNDATVKPALAAGADAGEPGLALLQTATATAYAQVQSTAAATVSAQ